MASEIIDKAKKAISKGELEEAIKMLITFFKGTSSENEILIQSARLEELKKKRRTGILDSQFENIETNNIRNSLLEMISDSNGGKQVKSKKTLETLKVLLVIGGLIIIIALGWIYSNKNSSNSDKIENHRNDKVKIRVFNFLNYEDETSLNKIGERFSGAILNELIKQNINELAIDEAIQTDFAIHPRRSGEPSFEVIIREFPTIAITGYIETFLDNQFINVTVRASYYEKDMYFPETFFIDEVSILDNQEEFKESAKELANKILNAAKGIEKRGD